MDKLTDELTIKVDEGRCICCRTFTDLKSSYLCATCLGSDTRKIDGLISKLIDKIQKNNTALRQSKKYINRCIKIIQHLMRDRVFEPADKLIEEFEAPKLKQEEKCQK